MPVYVWGSGGAGQLGLGDEEDHAVPQRLALAADGVHDAVVRSGGCHSAGIDSVSGELYVWGDNEKQQVGTPGVGAVRSSPGCAVSDLPAGARAKLVACGWWTTLVVATGSGAADGTEQGDYVVSWGSNDSDLLGRSVAAGSTDGTPGLVEGLPSRLRVASLSCGWKHALLASDDGAVFSWGVGRHGQLGLGDDALAADRPRRVSALDGTAIQRVRCGWQHSVFHAQSGRVFTCGSNRHGQLGVESAAKTQPEPVLVTVAAPDGSEAPVVAAQVDCGWHFVLCLAVGSRQLVSWGKGSHGQLALGTTRSQRRPCVVDFPVETARQIACGSEHVLVVTDRGELFTCGWGEHGNLGHGDKENRPTLERVAFFAGMGAKVVAAAAGGAVSIAVTG